MTKPIDVYTLSTPAGGMYVTPSRADAEHRMNTQGYKLESHPSDYDGPKPVPAKARATKTVANKARSVASTKKVAAPAPVADAATTDA